MVIWKQLTCIVSPRAAGLLGFRDTVATVKRDRVRSSARRRSALHNKSVFEPLLSLCDERKDVHLANQRRCVCGEVFDQRCTRVLWQCCFPVDFCRRRDVWVPAYERARVRRRMKAAMSATMMSGNT
jgi:hypothetical protein